MKKSKIILFGIAILGIISALLVETSLIGIFRPINKGEPKIGDRVEINPEYAAHVYIRESPFTGKKEHYYAIFSHNSETAFLVKANESWANYFDPETAAANTFLFQRGTVRKFNVPQEMKSIERDLEKFGISGVVNSYYIDLTAERQFTARLIVGMIGGAVCIVLIIVFFVNWRLSGKEDRKCQERRSSYVVY